MEPENILLFWNRMPGKVEIQEQKSAILFDFSRVREDP